MGGEPRAGRHDLRDGVGGHGDQRGVGDDVHVVQPRGQPGLGGAEHVADTALGEVLLRDAHAVLLLGQDLEPAQRRVPVRQARGQQADRRPGPAAHAAAQLVQGGQAEVVGVEDRHDRRVGHVHAHLHDGGRHEHVRLPAREGLHRRVLLGLVHAPVHGVDPQPRQRRETPQPGCHLLHVGVTRVGVVGVDARAHHERLVAGRHVLGDQLPHAPDHARAVGHPRHVRGDRLSPRGQPLEHRQVQVAEHRHRHGARDGRGGHDEQVRAGVGPPQGLALVHAEAVLLVDDGQGQLGEAHLLGEQGVRPHGDPGLAGGQGQQGLAACGGLERAGDQHDPRGRAVAGPEGAGLRKRAHQAQQGTVVLRGEHLGGRHQGGLAAGVHDLQHRPQGHERLARAHVPLQQPAHRGLPGQLGGQLLPHRHLAGRERERQAGVQGLEQAAGPRRAGHGGHRPLPVPAPGERGLDKQRLTQGQRGPRRAGGGDVVRGVQVPVRLGGARQRRVQVERRGGLRADPLGEQFRDAAQVDGLEHPGDGGADRPRRQLPRGPVERDRSHVHLPRGDVVAQ